jgi:uncharacterized membrane protein
MVARLRHARSYHKWARSTPVADAVMTVVAVASVVIGGHALLFLALALMAGNTQLALANGLVLVTIAMINGLLDVLRWWRRHHD